MTDSYRKIQKKIILLLMAGVALGATHSLNRQWKIIKDVSEEWKEIDRKALNRSIKRLYQSRLIYHNKNLSGSINLILNKKGKELALKYNLDQMTLSRPKKWDNKWRMVMFDIPEKYRKSRDSLRFRLKQIEFFEYQKSVFVTPYPCLQEVEFLREFYRVKDYVRIIHADRLENEINLKKHFNLR